MRSSLTSLAASLAASLAMSFATSLAFSLAASLRPSPSLAQHERTKCRTEVHANTNPTISCSIWLLPPVKNSDAMNIWNRARPKNLVINPNNFVNSSMLNHVANNISPKKMKYKLQTIFSIKIIAKRTYLDYSTGAEVAHEYEPENSNRDRNDGEHKVQYL